MQHGNRGQSRYRAQHEDVDQPGWEDHGATLAGWGVKSVFGIREAANLNSLKFNPSVRQLGQQFALSMPSPMCS